MEMTAQQSHITIKELTYTQKKIQSKQSPM